MARSKKEVLITESSGNVFADLGLDNPEELKIKATIARLINKIIKKSGHTQARTAKILGISQPQVSDLKRGQLKHFSVERLFEFLNAFGRDVEIVIKKKNPRTLRSAHTKVKAA